MTECVLQVGVVGINHKTANLSFREAMARSSASLAGEKSLFFGHPIVLLSTCNRTEIYFGGADLAAIHSDLLAWLRGYMAETFEHRLYSYFGLDCFIHLARVAAGLDSAILAETEIQAQVKTAYSSTCAFTKLPAGMHYIFQKALKISKLVRSQMQMQKTPGLLQAIWQLAYAHLPSLAEARILFVGYSEINRRLSCFLRQRKLTNFTWITHQLCEEPSVYPYEAIEMWRDFDWIICASGHDRYLLEGESRSRHAIFDLSVPRNVNPNIARGDGVVLYNIEEINAWIQKQNLQAAEQSKEWDALIRHDAVRLARIYRQRLSVSMRKLCRS